MAQQLPDAANTLSQLKDIVLVLVGGIIGFLSSWIVSRRERKWARADQRRERIYGPLQDELAIIGVALPNNEDTLQTSVEYWRIKSEHIRYMIPRKLRGKVVELYEQVLQRYGEEKTALGRKCNNMMGTEITHGLIPAGGDLSLTVTATSSSHVASMANLSYWLVEGKIPRNMERDSDSLSSRERG